MSDETGVDLSHWNGRVDFDEAQHQIQFAMCKATQGVDYVDPSYHRDIRELRQHKINRGSYHFADPHSGTAAEQAAYYVEHAERRDGEMQALDFEAGILEISDPVGWAFRWLSHVRQLTGNLPIIYMSGSVTGRFNWRPVIELGVGLWVASWGPRAQYSEWPFAIMWQRDDDGNLRGADGRVDYDVFHGDAARWQSYANNGGQPIDHRGHHHDPHPTPQPRYEVQPGDSLVTIAQRFGTTWQHLVELNELRYPSLRSNPNMIRVGCRLRVPASPRKGV